VAIRWCAKEQQDGQCHQTEERQVAEDMIRRQAGNRNWAFIRIKYITTDKQLHFQKYK
jgi:hypothetical protein